MHTRVQNTNQCQQTHLHILKARELYELDSNISENRIEEIMRGYEMKIDLFSRWQKGEDLKKIVVNFKSKPSNKNMKDIFVE